MSSPNHLSRREWMKLCSAGVVSAYSVPWFQSLAHAGVKRPRGKSCILLWMDGGPSQQHTFDPKRGGEFESIPTSVPGIHFSECLPKLAQCAEDLAVMRSMRTDINDHYDAKYLMHTGYKRVTNFEHPAIGSIASKEVGLPNDELPAFVTIDAGNDKGNGGRFYRSVPAYMGPEHAPLAVQAPEKGLDNLRNDSDSLDARLNLLAKSEERFAADYPVPAVLKKQSSYERAVKLMRSPRSKAFNVEEEPMWLREQYGLHRFGQSCLLARRLVESGVSFVEVFHRGWDDHEGAGKRIAARAPWMDAGMSALILDLKSRGMLEDTLIVWMGEFGRSPGNGSGHHCRAWSTVWAGGGINTGITIGKTDDRDKNTGGSVEERPISAGDYMASLCKALGIDPHKEVMAPGLRPITLADPKAKIVEELFA